MRSGEVRSVSGHVFLVQRAKGPQWYAKYRRGDGRQIKTRVGPVWTGRGRAPEGWFTRRTAEAWLHDKLTELDGHARRGARLDVTFAEAAEEWLRHGAEERGCKPSTMRDYRNAVRKSARTGVRRAPPARHHAGRHRGLARGSDVWTAASHHMSQRTRSRDGEQRGADDAN